MAEQFHIEGLRELQLKLKKLGPAVGGKALRSAAMTATLPLLRQAQANAPVRQSGGLKKTYKGRKVAPGFLKRNIGRKSLISKDKRRAIVLVGPKKEAFYGTQFVEVGKTKKHQSEKNPWLEPAFRQTRQQVLARFEQRLKVLIEKAAK